MYATSIAHVDATSPSPAEAATSVGDPAHPLVSNDMVVDGQHLLDQDGRGMDDTPVVGQPQQVAVANDATSSYKRKRGKYISRACLACQRRKVKCDGGQPCSQCAARQRTCVTAPRSREAIKAEAAGTASKVSEDMSWDGGREAYTVPVVDDSSMTRELLARVDQLERHLSMFSLGQAKMQVPSVQVRHAMQANQSTQGHRSSSLDTYFSSSSSGLESILEPDGPTFAGEAKISHRLRSVLDSKPGKDPSSSPSPSSPPPSDEGVSGGAGKLRGWLEKTFSRCGLVADRVAWQAYLRVFFDEIHILYPFLHPPSVWRIFDEMWEYSALWIMSDPADREQHRLSVALVCMCLALGRCSSSTRMEDVDGVHSAGWTLYNAGMSLIQDSLDPEGMNTSLIALQVSVARVMYLFRLDAPQKAARILSILITNAHIADLHRQRTIESLPVFRGQMLCRLWWTLYCIDRRMALESGRPFAIQDANVDSELPLPLSDEWLGRYVSRTETMSQVRHDVSLEIARAPVTAVPYIEGLVRFYRVVGMAWPVIYGTIPTQTGRAAAVEYIDAAVRGLVADPPRGLSYKPGLSWEEQFRRRPQWQAKQAMLLYTFCSFLRLLATNSCLSSDPNAEQATSRRNGSGVRAPDGCPATTCAVIAGEIIRAHESIQEPIIKFSYPFIHCLISASMVMANIVGGGDDDELRTQYGPLLAQAARTMKLYCCRIWVSGRMMRTVSRLNSLVYSIMSEKSHSDSEECWSKRTSSTVAGRLTAVPDGGGGDPENPQDRPQATTPPSRQFSPGEHAPVKQCGSHSVIEQTVFPVSAMGDFGFESIIMAGDHGEGRFGHDGRDVSMGNCQLNVTSRTSAGLGFHIDRGLVGLAAGSVDFGQGHDFDRPDAEESSGNYMDGLFYRTASGWY